MSRIVAVASTLLAGAGCLGAFVAHLVGAGHELWIPVYVGLAATSLALLPPSRHFLGWMLALSALALPPFWIVGFIRELPISVLHSMSLYMLVVSPLLRIFAEEVDWMGLQGTELVVEEETPGVVRLWDVGTGREVGRYKSGRLWTSAHAIAFSPDGKLLASEGEHATVSLWDVGTTRERLQLDGHEKTITFVQFSRDGKYVASASHDDTIRIWDTASGRELRKWKTDGLLGATMSPDGKTVASGHMDKIIRVWSSDNPSEIHRLVGHTDTVLSVAFSPDGNVLASGGNFSDGTVRLWDVATGRQIRVMKAWGYISTVAFSPDGATLVSGGTELRFWDVVTGTELRKLKTKFLDRVSYSPDGKLLATSHDRSILIWDVKRGKVLHELGGRGYPVASIAFSPRGGTLASGELGQFGVGDDDDDDEDE